MKPNVHALTDIFGGDGRYVVPLYQRPYVWQRESHWEPLWSDVRSVLEQHEAGQAARHFLGAVVLQQEQTDPGQLPLRLLIDGQQRLTTLQLLLGAAVESAREAGAARPAKLLDRLVRNDELMASGDELFKVWPTNADQHAFRLVMQPGGPPDDAADDPNNQIQEAYDYFLGAIREWAVEGGVDPDALESRYETLRVGLSSLLQVVSINLEDGDDAQVIFETLNARGTPLLAMDLVKNAVFHRARQQGHATDDLHENVWMTELGQDYWRQEQRQGRLLRPRAELFLGHWLAMQLADIIKATELFPIFRGRILDAHPQPDAEQLVRELCHDAGVLRSFETLPPGTSEARFFRVLRGLDTTTLYPVALALAVLPEVNDEQRRRALAALESYFVRRNLLGLTSKNYTQLSARLVGEIRRSPDAADDVVIRSLCSSTADTYRWPADEELLEHLSRQPLYGWLGRAKIVLVLSELELARRASVKTEAITELPPKLSIEHVLPQQWETHWPLPHPADEQVKERRLALVNTLGNLTLVTGELNASLSNGPWPGKRQHLQTHSLLRLNSDLVQSDSWDEDAIVGRGRVLASEIVATWPGPQTFEPGYDPDSLTAPQHEENPQAADMSLEDVQRAYREGSQLLRQLLAELASQPTTQRPFALIEEDLGWRRGLLASVLGGWSNTARVSYAGKRPFRIGRDDDGAWWMWLDGERASAIANEIGRS